MSDPAIKAAQRAFRDTGLFGPESGKDPAITAAREALKPIRELHYRVIADWDDHPFCASCWGPHGPTGWPCVTAKLIYTTEELER